MHRIGFSVIALCCLAAGAVHAQGTAKTCGGASGLACPAGQWCEPAAGRCGSDDIHGSCVSVPEVCTFIYAPVCGCDGKTHGNDCARRAARVAKRHDGECGRRE